METLSQTLVKTRSWSIKRLKKVEPVADKNAIYKEFAEWIEPQGEELEIVTLDEISEEEYEDFIERG